MVWADLRKLDDLLLPADRRRIWATAILIALAALLQLASLVALYSFLASISSPDAALPGPVQRFAAQAGLDGPGAQRVGFAAVCFGLLVAANAAMVLVERSKFRLEGEMHASLSTRLLAAYLARDYPFFVQEHSTRLSKNVLQGVREISTNVLRPALDLGNKATQSVTIIALLLYLDPFVSLVVAAVMAVGFAAVYVTTRPWIRRQGRSLNDGQRDRFRVVNEALGGIKEAKVLGREEAFARRFESPARRMATAQTSVEFSFSLHKYALETVAFGAILLVVSGMVLAGRPIAAIVPIVGLLAIAGYRLLPAFRDISTALSQFNLSSAVLDEVWRDFTAGRPAGPVPDALPLRESFGADHVGFAYADGGPVLHDVTVRIEVGSVVGFAGRSGSGKSTLADLLMGLMRPQAGSIVVDGQPLQAEQLPAWRRNIGYVPQEIFLTDATIAENIAFGVPPDEIDHQAVRRAAALAQLAVFVEDQLPQGYQTIVGERGVKLSGGQRQRIGIARALYHDPPVLILDEATSDVDGATEASIAQAMRSLSGRKTVLIIAHRLTAIRSCESIYFLDRGRVAGHGTYEDLVRRSPAFRSTVEGLPHA